jgi:hypothetical protein
MCLHPTERGLSCFSMRMLDERLQVLIGREQRERLEREAGRRGTSVAALAREAIDLTFPPKMWRRVCRYPAGSVGRPGARYVRPKAE